MADISACWTQHEDHWNCYDVETPIHCKKKQRFNKTWIADMVLISAHFFVYFAVPMMFGFKFLNLLIFYIAIWSLVGSMLMAIFIVGHTGKPVVGNYDSNFMLQIETGRSIKTNFITRFFFVGLDKQIEHHLLQAYLTLICTKCASCQGICRKAGMGLRRNWIHQGIMVVDKVRPQCMERRTNRHLG